MKSVLVDIPPLTEQKKIANVLSALDDKIENNKRTNRILEEICQALYKRWFVDFDFPNEDGEPYKSSGGKMVDSELGEIPAGWKTGFVSDIIEFHDSKRVPLSNRQRSKMIKKNYPYYGAASLMDYVDDYIFDGIYLLFGEDGTVIDTNGKPILHYVWGKFWVNNHAHVLTGKLGYEVESLYLLFKQTTVRSFVTGAVQPKINQSSLRSIQVVVPPQTVMKKFNKAIKPFFENIRTGTNENSRLVQIRDTLLPRLMSGEIEL